MTNAKKRGRPKKPNIEVQPPELPTPEQWVTPKELAKIIPWRPWTIRQLIREGHLKHGYHYIDKRLPGRERPTYVLNIFRIKEFLAMRPELREE